MRSAGLIRICPSICKQRVLINTTTSANNILEGIHMSGDLDDFDALFEEISAQRAETVSAATPAAAPVSEPPAASPAPAAPVAKNDTANAEEVDASDKPMFERLGGIVRLLHDSLRELGYDRSLSDVASQITDAQGRLEYIGSLTEQAANKVLNAIDVGMPAQDALAKQAKDIDGRWTQLYDGKLSVEEFKTLANDSRQFTSKVSEVTEAEKARLLEIMMAQDFQDITGQLIKKIVTITAKAEKELALLLRDNAPPEIKAAHAEPKPDAPVELMNGPSGASAMVQDDVDSLLADLGF
jgi:chemotaxis protein CheZ